MIANKDPAEETRRLGVDLQTNVLEHVAKLEALIISTRHLKTAPACDLGYMTDHAKKIAQGVQENLSYQADKEQTTL